MPTCSLNGVNFHYEQRGSGRPLVLLHGFPLDGRIFDPLVDQLAGNASVIVPDLRGFGRSSDEQPFTIASLAEDVSALLQRLGAIPCVLGGLSMGGYVALALARKCPQDLDGLILIDSRAAADTPEGRQGRQAMIERVRTGGPAAVAEQMLPKMLSPRTAERRPELVAVVREMMQRCPARTIEHALVGMRDRDDYTDELPSLADPTLVIVGQDDAITPPAGAQAMAEQIPRCKLVVVNDAGHLSPLEQPQAVAAAIREYLAAL